MFIHKIDLNIAFNRLFMKRKRRKRRWSNRSNYPLICPDQGSQISKEATNYTTGSCAGFHFLQVWYDQSRADQTRPHFLKFNSLVHLKFSEICFGQRQAKEIPVLHLKGLKSANFSADSEKFWVDMHLYNCNC